MNDADLERMLGEWFLDELLAAPGDDPHHTAECLSFAELQAMAKDPNYQMEGHRRRHQERCLWCLKALETARRVESTPVVGMAASVEGPEEPAVRERGVPRGSMGESPWSDAVRAFLAKRVQARSLGADEPTPVRIDGSGTLQVDLPDYADNSKVRISLLLEDDVFPLGRATVRNGLLSKSVDYLGLRDVRLPADLVRIEKE